MNPGQVSDPWVNSASVYGLNPASIDMSFSLRRDNFKRPVTRSSALRNPRSRANFSSFQQNAKVAPWARVDSGMLNIKVQSNSFKKEKSRKP